MYGAASLGRALRGAGPQRKQVRCDHHADSRPAHGSLDRKCSRKSRVAGVSSPIRADSRTIRERLLNRQDQLLKSSYYEVARHETKATNYLSKRIIDQANKNAK